MSAPPCQRCGSPLPPGAHFCPTCGAPAPDAAGAERKVVTMVFADLVGSTALSVGRDPEELRALLGRYFEAARAVLEEHGGTVEKFIGDAVLAVFGAPVAHGDDPDRAISAALALVERVDALGEGLAVRVGVNTGDVLFAGPGSDLSVAGEAVNVAARLEQAAAPGEVLVGERTVRAARLARLVPGPAIDAKGIPEPVATWRAQAVERARAPSATRMVGRDDDLELLELVYRRAVRERVPQLVTIMGDAGIGKTRLASELLDGLRATPEAPGVLVGRNPPYGRGIAFWALAEILRAAAGVDARAPADAVRKGLAGRLAAAGAADAPQVAATLTLALSGAGNGDERPEAAEALPRAWRRLVGLLAAERPLVLAIDDAHWADDGLLELVETVTHGLQDAPLLVLCTARPELLDRRPDWGRSARNATLLELTPLRGEAAAALAEAVLGTEAAGSAPAIAAAGGGNPFFVEEIARGLAQGGAAAYGPMPDTVQAAIAGRIDLLPPAEKRALRTAAVLGETFSEAGLRELLGEDPAAAVQELARRELVQERAAEGAGVYRFRHQLVRDVAYESLPRVERSALHERAAGWLDASRSDRYPEVAELVAFHRRQSADLAPSAERRHRAHAALRTAALSGRARGATGRAQELYEQAAELAGTAAERAQDLGAAARVALDRFRGDDALALFRAAADALREAGDEAGAWRETAWAIQVSSRNPGLMAQRIDVDELLAEIDDLIRKRRTATTSCPPGCWARGRSCAGSARRARWADRRRRAVEVGASDVRRRPAVDGARRARGVRAGRRRLRGDRPDHARAGAAHRPAPHARRARGRLPHAGGDAGGRGLLPGGETVGRGGTPLRALARPGLQRLLPRAVPVLLPRRVGHPARERRPPARRLAGRGRARLGLHGLRGRVRGRRADGQGRQQRRERLAAPERRDGEGELAGAGFAPRDLERHVPGHRRPAPGRGGYRARAAGADPRDAQRLPNCAARRCTARLWSWRATRGGRRRSRAPANLGGDRFAETVIARAQALPRRRHRRAGRGPRALPRARRPLRARAHRLDAGRRGARRGGRALHAPALPAAGLPARAHPVAVPGAQRHVALGSRERPRP